jgi:hypothetical protein
VVRDAIASTQQQVVAVVYNAVDDHLSGSNQIHVRWTVDDLRLLGPLLSEARRARRVVIITADHGHVIDDWHGAAWPGGGRSLAAAFGHPGRERVAVRGRPSENRVRQCGGLRLVGGCSTRGQEERLSRRRIGAGSRRALERVHAAQHGAQGLAGGRCAPAGLVGAVGVCGAPLAPEAPMRSPASHRSRNPVAYAADRPVRRGCPSRRPAPECTGSTRFRHRPPTWRRRPLLRAWHPSTLTCERCWMRWRLEAESFPRQRSRSAWACLRCASAASSMQPSAYSTWTKLLCWFSTRRRVRGAEQGTAGSAVSGDGAMRGRG